MILQSIDPDAVMGVFPADHVIGGLATTYGCSSRVQSGCRREDRGPGNSARWAETGYGYIEFPQGVKPGDPTPVDVASFREKPDAETAARFLGAGNFYWNAGMFFWRTSVLLDALRQFLPKTASVLASLPSFGSRRFAAQLADTFPRCENISIDYAVLERASNVAGSQRAISDGTTWEAGTPFTNCSRAIPPATRAAPMRSFTRAPGITWMRRRSWSLCSASRIHRGGHAGRAADRGPQQIAGSRRTGEAIRKVRPPRSAVSAHIAPRILRSISFRCGWK